MSDTPSRTTSWLLIGLCGALAIGSLFLHPDAGPGKYPLIGAGATAALVLIVRLLRPVLRSRTGDDHAD